MSGAPESSCHSQGLATLARVALFVGLVALLQGCAPRDPAQVLDEAEQHLEAGDTRTAAILMQSLVQGDPTNVEARILLARIAFAAGDAGLARSHLEAALERGAPAERVSLPLALALLETNEPQAALDALDSIPVAARGFEHWLTAGRALTRLARVEQAHDALDRAAAQVGDRADLHLARAELALARGDRAGARNALEAALAIDPQDPEALSARGMLASMSDRPDAAVADLEAAVRQYESRGQLPRAAGLLLRLVQLHLVRNDLEAAAVTARRLSAAVPNAAFVDYANGLVAFQRADYEDTIRLLRLALTKAPGQPEFQALLGAAHLAVGNLGQAEQQFLSVLAASPSDPAARRLLAETRVRQQRPQAALETLRSFAAADFERDVGLLLLQSTAHLQNDEAEAAVPYLEQALAINPGDQAVALQLARAYAETGRSAEAFEVLQSSPALTLDADYSTSVLVLLSRLQNEGVASAESFVAGLLAERPEEAATQMLAAILSQLTDDRIGARARLAAALELDDRFVPARLSLAALLAEEGRLSEARTELETVLNFEPANLAASMSLAQLAVMESDLASAEAHLLAAAENARVPAPRLALARLYVSRGDLELAQAQADLAAELAPSQVDLQATRGLIALARGAASEAVQLFRGARDALPNRPTLALLLAQALAADGDLRGARDTLDAAASSMPAVAELRSALGAAELALGNRDAALSIARALQVDYGRRSAGFTLEAQMRMAERAYGEAARLYSLAYERDGAWTTLAALVTAMRLSGSTLERYTSLLHAWLADAPADTRARLLLADLLANAREIELALDEYARIIELEPEHVVALNNAAWYAHELGRPAAHDYANRALEIAPENPAVLDTLGWILTRQNRASEGHEYLLSATRLAPQALEIRYHLAVAQAQLGQNGAARETLRSLLNEPQAFESRQAAEALLASL